MGVRMGPSGLLLLLLATLACAALGQQECPANPYVPGGGCSPEPNICQLTCKKGADPDECEQTESCTKAEVPATVIVYNDMTPDKCKELCTASDAHDGSAESPRCRFWRYEVGAGPEKTCSLMKDDQCNVYQHCPASVPVENGCVTEDVGCPGGVTP